MSINRTDVPLGPTRGLGKAALLLRMFNRTEAPATLLVTNRCDLSCRHCYAARPNPPVDLEPDLIKSTADELAGASRLYYSGGEPLLYRANEPDHLRVFMDLAHYTAGRVKRLYIDTNGSFLAPDVASAVSQLTDFPKNSTFVLSLDEGHAIALSARGKSLKQIYITMKEACGKNGLGFEINIRKRSDDKGCWREVQAFDHDFPVTGKNVHINTIYAQGEAMELPPGQAKAVDLDNLVDHINSIHGIGIFVTPRGEVVSGDHAAFLDRPPELMVWGNLNHSTLASILWNKLAEIKTTDPNVLGVPEAEQAQALCDFLSDPILPMRISVLPFRFQQYLRGPAEALLASSLPDVARQFARYFLAANSLPLHCKNVALERFQGIIEQGVLRWVTSQLDTQFLADTPSESLKLALHHSFEIAERSFGAELAIKYFLLPFKKYLQDRSAEAQNRHFLKVCLKAVDLRLAKYHAEQADISS
ncbi:radical SAM protein [Candidatus Saganbacteria bacterium]|nr:radical SAM protein [Candidatus Saganbacteria bacterium]